MTDRIDGIALAVSIALTILVLELVRRRKLTEDYSVIWILCTIGLVVLSWRHDLLDRSARWLGVSYPPSVLTLALLLAGFLGGLFFSVALSRQRKQIERLVEDTVILTTELRELRTEIDRRHESERGTSNLDRGPM